MSPRAVAISLFLLPGLLFLNGCSGQRQAAPKAPPSNQASNDEADVSDQKPMDVAPVVEPTPPDPTPKLTLFPAQAELGPDDPGVQLVLLQEQPDGPIVDLTRQVQWKVEPAGIVSVDEAGYMTPIAAGEATIRPADHPDAPACKVRVDQGDRPWDFATDIVPLLTRAGCNTGGCHGKADGQNGFHLSLFGYDPANDYLEISHESGGRRLSTFNPDESLFFRKATGRIPHSGGQRITPGSPDEQLLRAWLAAGAPQRSGETHGALDRVVVEPGNFRLEQPGPVQLRVVAHYEDGHQRDVTRSAIYRVNDDSTATVNEQGLARLSRRAETDLVVRYQSYVLSTRIATPINPDLEFDFAALPRANYIDDALFRRLESLRVPPSPRSDDATFLRRVTLDLIGQQPRPEEIRQFLEDTDPEKRAKLVDRLMADKYFVDFWLIKLSDLLQISTARFGNGRGLYENWVKESLIQNRPWNEFVTLLLTSTGNPYDPQSGGPVNYALEGEDARVQAELTAQRFLGLRFRCAQCHDHPFDVWTQDDYYGLAAFFAKVQRPVAAPGQMMAMAEVSVNPDGFVEHLRTQQPATPRFPGAGEPELAKEEDPRKALAEWITSKDNPYFARSVANWVWGQFFGRGLVDPVDDLSASNPPVHPELLDALARDFVENKYDLRHLIRAVATSEAYGLASTTIPGNEQDRRLFSHQTPRPLTAHQIADALAQATDTSLRFSLARGGAGSLVTRKAIEINDPAISSTLLDTFGRCRRDNGCSPVPTPELSLRQSLLLIGGTVIDDRIEQFDGYLSSLLEFDPTPAEIVENLYLRTLCRKPTEEESSLWSSELDQASSLREASEDLFWALLNSREFAFNH